MEGKNQIHNWTYWDRKIYSSIKESYNFDTVWKKFLDSNNALYPTCTWYPENKTCVPIN